MGFGKVHQPANLEVASFSRCKNIKGELQKFKGPLAHGHAHFFPWCDVMMALGKPNLHTKFEVVSISRCRNIKGNRKILGSSPRPGPRPLFLWM